MGCSGISNLGVGGVKFSNIGVVVGVVVGGVVVLFIVFVFVFYYFCVYKRRK